MVVGRPASHHPPWALTLLLFLFLGQGVLSAQYRTLLYGDKLKGFMTVSPADNEGKTYVLSFDLSVKPEGPLRWGVHVSSAPYDMAVMTDNCRRVKKSYPIIKNMPLETSTISGEGLAGNTVVISGDNYEVLACATVILPGEPLKYASFHEEPIEGQIHIIPLSNKMVRMLPDLKYMRKFDNYEPDKSIFTWAFVDDCKNISKQETDYSEIGVDSRATFTFEFSKENYTMKSLAIFEDDKLFACTVIKNVEPRSLRALGLTLSQNHYFEPVRTRLNPPPVRLHIRDDCLDISTETIHETFNSYYPSLNIFGGESIVLKSLVKDNQCSALRPLFAKPAAIANFMHPLAGRLTLLDIDDKIVLTGELKNLFDEMATRATVLISDKPLDSSKCSQATCNGCYAVQDSAVVVGKNEESVTMAGVFLWFDIFKMKSVIIDLMYMKACANLTVLPHGSLTTSAIIRHRTAYQAKTVASIVALEYPANNYTEVLMNKNQQFKKVEVHYRPLDRTITHAPPCSELNLGPIKKVPWLNKIKTKLGSNHNDSSVIIEDTLITGKNSIVGTSILLADDEHVYCGFFEHMNRRRTAFAEFRRPFVGYLKLSEYEGSGWKYGIPTQVYYSLNSTAFTNSSLIWDIVTTENSTCESSPIFDPLEVNITECHSHKTDFCPIGLTSIKSPRLTLNSTHHFVVTNLPLSGPFSVIGKSVRIGFPDQFSCATLQEVAEATIQWVVSSTLSINDVQNLFAKKTNIPLYKIEIDYTRIPYEEECSLYRITVFESEEMLETIVESFDLEGRRFKSDMLLNCSKVEPVTTQMSTTNAPLYSLILLLISFVSC